jgi:hypothetical protein
VAERLSEVAVSAGPVVAEETGEAVPDVSLADVDGGAADPEVLFDCETAAGAGDEVAGDRLLVVVDVVGAGSVAATGALLEGDGGGAWVPCFEFRAATEATPDGSVARGGRLWPPVRLVPSEAVLADGGLLVREPSEPRAGSIFRAGFAAEREASWWCAPGARDVGPDVGPDLGPDRGGVPEPEDCIEDGR